MFRHHGTSARIAAPAILAVVFWIGPGAAAPASAPSLTVTGLIHTPLALTAADLAAMPRTTLSISDDNGNRPSMMGCLFRKFSSGQVRLRARN